MFLEKYRVPIPDPEESRVKPDGKVQHKVYSVSSERRVWTTIGKLPPEGRQFDEDGNQLMIPNSVYRESFSGFYEEDVVDKDPDNIAPFFQREAKVGPYALFLGAVTKSGLYDLLIDVFGIETANALLDLAMFYNMANTIDTRTIRNSLEEFLVFSVRVHTADWYHMRLDLPSTGITDRKIAEFMRRWTALRLKTDPRDTAIQITATGADWVYRNPTVDQQGVMAICETGGDYPGMPLAYHLYRGFFPARAEAKKALRLFRDLGLAPKRITASKPFCRIRFLNLCDELHMPWLVMMQQYYVGHETMLDRHETELFEGHGTPIKARKPLVATAEDNITLFDYQSADPDRKAFVGFYCMSRDAAERREYFEKKRKKTFQDACAALEKIQNSDEKDKLPIPGAGDKKDDTACEKNAPNENEEDETSEGEDFGNEYIDHYDYDAPEERVISILKSAVSDAGGPFYHVDREAWNSLKLVYDHKEGRYHCAVNEDEAQYYRCQDCYIALASSEPMDLQEMSDAIPLSYWMGDNEFSPTFSAMHMQLNNPIPGYSGFSTWFFMAYISDIVRALLMPSFKLFEADPYGELKAASLRGFTKEELEERKPEVLISIRKMISWLYDISFMRPNAANFFWFAGPKSGVRKDVLEAAGVPIDSIQLFSDLAESSEYPEELRKLRQMKRTIPKPYVPKRRGRPKSSQSGPSPS